MATLPNFDKLVVSLWFNAPAASLAAARSQYMSATSVFPNTDFRLPGVLPLLTLGPNAETYTIYDGLGDAISSGNVSPFVIGVACGDSGDGTFRNSLYARMQYATGAPGAAPAVTVYNDFFQVGALLSPCQVWGTLGDGSFIDVSGDVWNNAIISMDLSGGCSTTYDDPNLIIGSTCSFFWAFNDVDYNNNYLWPNTPHAIPGNSDVPNGIFSDRCVTTPSHSFAAGNIPASGYPTGVPADGSNSAKIYDVRLADVQVFLDRTLDTSVEENRRLFISADKKPVSPSIAAAHFGKSPEILFRTFDDWRLGNNRGTAGNFAPSGSITSFSPSPS